MVSVCFPVQTADAPAVGYRAAQCETHSGLQAINASGCGAAAWGGGEGRGQECFNIRQKQGKKSSGCECLRAALHVQTAPAAIFYFILFFSP